ncbi:MAG: hypothetical protein ACJASI_002473 [Glaciecola sp.]|jgi:hypothetical protein
MLKKRVPELLQVFNASALNIGFSNARFYLHYSVSIK